MLRSFILMTVPYTSLADWDDLALGYLDLCGLLNTNQNKSAGKADIASLNMSFNNSKLNTNLNNDEKNAGESFITWHHEIFMHEGLLPISRICLYCDLGHSCDRGKSTENKIIMLCRGGESVRGWDYRPYLKSNLSSLSHQNDPLTQSSL